MNDRIRFYLDEHVAHAVAHGLTIRGVDVLTTTDAGMLEASDEKQLAFALDSGRVIFSQDSDFLRLHAEGNQHAGIVFAPQNTTVGQIVAGLMLVFDLMTAEEMENCVEFL